MLDELADLMDIAIYREIASHAFYVAAQGQTTDPSVKVLLKELASEEQKHTQMLKDIKEKGLIDNNSYQEKVPNLKISEYLTGGDTLEGASLHDTILFAVKREQQAVEFYSNMVDLMKDKTAKHLCENLANEERKHKQKLEKIYEKMLFGRED